MTKKSKKKTKASKKITALVFFYRGEPEDMQQPLEQLLTDLLQQAGMTPDDLIAALQKLGAGSGIDAEFDPPRAARRRRSHGPN